MPEVRVLKRFCKGCGLCVDACPAGCLRMGTTINDQGLQTAEVVEAAKCMGCLQCHAVCPDAAVEVYVAGGQVKVKCATLARSSGAARDGGPNGQR